MSIKWIVIIVALSLVVGCAVPSAVRNVELVSESTADNCELAHRHRRAQDTQNQRDEYGGVGTFFNNFLGPASAMANRKRLSDQYYRICMDQGIWINQDVNEYVEEHELKWDDLPRQIGF